MLTKLQIENSTFFQEYFLVVSYLIPFIRGVIYLLILQQK